MTVLRTESPAVQRNQEDLSRALADAGVALSAREVRALIAGVAAAPPGFEADAWMALVAERPGPDLRRALSRALDEARRTPPPAVADHAARLAALRALLRRHRLAGVVVPRCDEHQGEYVPARAERLAWLTGFTGSAGTALVLADQALLFVDGRYTTQAAAEVDPRLFQVRHATHEPLVDTLAADLHAGARVGYDPWLHTPAQVAALEAACAKTGAKAVAIEANLVDRIWHDQPPAPISPVVVHADAFAGETSSSKRHRLGAALRGDRCAAAVLAQPDSIAWLLNIRGGDVPFSPLPLAFAILRSDGGVVLFVDPRKLTSAVRTHLGGEVVIAPPVRLGADLDDLGSVDGVRFDPAATPYWIVRRLRRAGATLIEGTDPCALPKAKKNAVEASGIRAAHVRDGAALCRFLAWLARAAPAGGVAEIAAAERLAAFRSEAARYRGPSFPTISGAGPDGAVVHYRATLATDRLLQPGELYLVDSGGQYLDGTTDVTRTVAIGTPDEEMRARFTLVLKGHVAIATARFPAGTTGSQLDALARIALWRAGFDYDHGTGHGVGAYLGVHEGPQRIAKLPNRVALEAGMVVSNEPGYYRPGAFGIRIENLVMVTPAETPTGGDQEMLAFDTLTLAPIDRTLVVRGMLTGEEATWLDTYHARVRNTLSALVDEATAAWLADVTRPIG